MSSSILALGLAGAVAAAPGAPPSVDPVERWVSDARTLHPEALAARENQQAAREGLRSARAWMPPSGQFQYKSDGTKELSLSQMLPGPGKLRGQQDVADRRLEMARADSAERLRRLELSVREAAWMEWMAWRKVEIWAARESLAVRLAASGRRLQAQGMGTATEAWLADAKVRRARIETDRARAEALSATAMRESWTGPGDRFAAPPPAAPDWDDAALARAAEGRSDIRAMEYDAAMQQAMGASMRTGLRPDVMVGGMVMQMPNGMAGWGVMAGMTMPFAPWSRGMQDGEAAAAQARSRATQARSRTMARMARAEVADHAAKARAAWRGLVELDSIVPTQERAVDDARARYAQGREMLGMVIQMEEMAAMTRMEAAMRRGEYELERARLHAAAGIILTSSPSGPDALARAVSLEATP